MRARPPWLRGIEIERPCKSKGSAFPGRGVTTTGRSIAWKSDSNGNGRESGSSVGKRKYGVFVIALMHWPRDLDTGVASGEAGSSGGDDRGLEAHYKYTKHPCIVVTFCEMNAAN